MYMYRGTCNVLAFTSAGAYTGDYGTLPLFLEIQNKRTARHMVVHVRQVSSGDDVTSASRSCALARYDASRIARDAMLLLNQFNARNADHSDTW